MQSANSFWILLVAAVAVATVVVANDLPACAADRPNIVLMMADDLGWGDTGYNGHPTLKTPHLDEMAKAGLRLERFYSGAPVCSPTRGSCLTGRHPFRYGVFSANVGHLPAEELALPELLGKLGYATGHFGKWHLGTLTKTVKESNRGGPRGIEHYSPPWENGFDVCFSTEAKVPTWDPMVTRKGAGNFWEPIENQADAVAYGTHYWTGEGKQATENLRGDDSRIIMDRAIPFVREAAKSETPFFAVIWFHAPHLPVVAGPKYTAM
jgi:arylsulfatase A-like enzyme